MLLFHFSYLLYRQLKRDLCSGRLVAQSDEMIRLGALVVQGMNFALNELFSASCKSYEVHFRRDAFNVSQG